MEIPERYLIPKDFRGVVYVVSDQENGTEKEYEGIHRVYRIPESGILFTQFSQNEDVIILISGILLCQIEEAHTTRSRENMTTVISIGQTLSIQELLNHQEQFHNI